MNPTPYYRGLNYFQSYGSVFLVSCITIVYLNRPLNDIDNYSGYPWVPIFEILQAHEYVVPGSRGLGARWHLKTCAKNMVHEMQTFFWWRVEGGAYGACLE